MPDVLSEGRLTTGPAGQPASPQRIGEMLIDRELIGVRDLEAALELQRKTGRRLGETLVALGLISSADVIRVLADRLGLDFVDLAETAIDSMVAQAIPEALARRRCVAAAPVLHSSCWVGVDV